MHEMHAAHGAIRSSGRLEAGAEMIEAFSSANAELMRLASEWNAQLAGCHLANRDQVPLAATDNSQRYFGVCRRSFTCCTASRRPSVSCAFPVESATPQPHRHFVR